MQGLRATIDIYFAEIEFLAQMCFPLQTEFCSIEGMANFHASSPVRSVFRQKYWTLEDLGVFLQTLHTYMDFRTRLKAVDDILQVGCFLVDRTHFVSRVVQSCDVRLAELFQKIPDICRQWFRELEKDVTQKAKVLSSIPESVDEVRKPNKRTERSGFGFLSILMFSPMMFC
jgi:hypothetical protein